VFCANGRVCGGRGNPNGVFDFGMLASYAGCLAATTVCAQFLKKLWPAKWPTQYLAYIIAVILLIVASLALETFTWKSVVLALLNGIVIALAANGVFANIVEVKTRMTLKGNPSTLAGNSAGNNKDSGVLG
jgi:RsiW-degrading membrane proteinase PrsW (M82 family)